MNENKNIDPKLQEALKGFWDSLMVLCTFGKNR